MTGAATGPIHRLAWAVTEADAMALITEAVLRGANPDDARDAFRIWQTLQDRSVIRLESA